MARIFVSYARTDRALVAPLVAALSAEGGSVWWAPAINAGEDFDSLSAPQLDAANAVIVAWTPAFSRDILVPIRVGNARLPLDGRTLADARLPYDCRSEAARVAALQ